MEYKRTTITLQKSLFKKVMQLAETEERSFNKQVITLLKGAIGNQINHGGEEAINLREKREKRGNFASHTWQKGGE